MATTRCPKVRQWVARSEFVFLCLVLVTGALLLFADLSDIYLWQDEAETALVARHLLAYGLPLSTDGRSWVQQAPEWVEFTRDYVWVNHPWLQYFAVGAAFAVFGESTLTARLPFSLGGLATLVFLYVLVLSATHDRRVARTAALLVLLHVPFILLARQCRYYSLSALFTIMTLDSFLRLGSGKTWSVPYFVLSAVLLFHSHLGAFFPTLSSLVMYSLLTRAPRAVWSRFLPALLLIAVLTAPWMHLFPVWRSAPGVSAYSLIRVVTSSVEPVMADPTVPVRGASHTVERFVGLLGQYFLHVTVWALPLILGLAALGMWLRRLCCGHPALSCHMRLQELLVVVVVSNLLALSAVGWAFFRYLAHLLPLLLALTAMIVVPIMQRWPVPGYALVMTLLVCNGVHILPYTLLRAAITSNSSFWTQVSASPATRWISGIRGLRLRSELWMYAQELTHPYQGPNEGLVAYLAERALPGQTILANYEDLPLQFYTNYRVLGGLSAHGLAPGIEPDWVIDRQYGHYRDLLAAIVNEGPYERITIPYPDIRWENREAAYEHHYLTVESESPVVLYRRLSLGPSEGQGH